MDIERYLIIHTVSSEVTGDYHSSGARLMIVPRDAMTPKDIKAIEYILASESNEHGCHTPDQSMLTRTPVQLVSMGPRKRLLDSFIHIFKRCEEWSTYRITVWPFDFDAQGSLTRIVNVNQC